MANASASTIFAVKFAKCQHQEAKNLLKCLEHRRTLMEVFEEEHGESSKTAEIQIECILNGGRDVYQVTQNMTVGDVKDITTHLHYQCKESEIDQALNVLNQAASDATKKTINAFQILMAGGRQLFVQEKTSSSGKKDSLNQKDVLYNSLVSDFKSKKLDFPKSVVKEEGAYIIQVLCNALWYVTNHIDTINAASRHKSNVTSFPLCYEQYKDINDTKRKKMKTPSLSADQLESHSQALYSVLMKPVMKSTPAWCKAHEDIKSLANCLEVYKNHLHEQLEVVTRNNEMDHPVRTVGKFTTVEHRQKVSFGMKEKYNLLNDDLLSKEIGTMLLFDENVHVVSRFQNNMQRHRFLEELQLTFPVDIFRFCPGSSIITTVGFIQVEDNRSEPQKLIDAARSVLQNQEKFKEYHTRAQKRAFKEKLENIAHISPMIVNFIYKELTLDASQANHQDTQERLRLIFLGEKGLVADLRKLNNGRPNGTFDVFFTNMSQIVEEVTAADERRQGNAHLSEWISLNDLMERTKDKCPENTQMPSKSLVRLQFAPRNPFARTAWNFTSKIDVQYKIQRRQLRLSHPDQHYCNALLKYFKQRAIDLKAENVNIYLFFCDDKAKVKVGEPGFAISSGVRGRVTIAPTNTTLVAGDHDMNKVSLTPSVTLNASIPRTVQESFVRGDVLVTVNDSIFQASNPFRHAASLVKTMSDKENPNIIMQYTDGGVDHRNTIQSVQCAAICIFKELNLDMLILARCAPGHSWRNPAERIMSLLNLGLQNCALERERSDDATEKLLKRCGSMADIRTEAEKKPELKGAYKESVEPVQSLIRNRFSRLKLKDQPVSVSDPMTDIEIDTLQRHLRELFPELDLKKLVKTHTDKVQSYQTWKENHCRERQYLFQIRKCQNPVCCIPSILSDEALYWLPDPVLCDDKEHFKPYEEVNGTDTSESDRPTFKVVNKAPSKTKKAKRSVEAEINDQTQDDDADDIQEVTTCTEDNYHASIFTSQNARGVVKCVECLKSRVYYSKTRLTERHQTLIALNISEYDYSCGAELADPNQSVLKNVFFRPGLTCAVAVELSYYGSGLGQPDICCFCASEGAEVSAELRKKYKTVLPICENCENRGLTAIVQRPYGNRK
ncbi:unnamed protein product [Mytilus edulis]|uniref:Uncharacterized protein n=1 Tax=Mytilus edulis TaxID=6550 RepID=A0A8S3RKH5_MYTED|nr:unnamed protein product [Mytilus edulis]